MIIWLVLIAVLVWTLVYRHRRRRLYELASKLPGSREDLPGIGIAYSLIGNNEEVMNTLQRFSYEAMDDQHNGLIRLWLNHILYIILVDPVDTNMIMKTCMEKDDLHRFMRNLIGNGLIFAPVSIWRKRRKILVPLFSPKIVESFGSVFSEQSEKLARNLGKCLARPLRLWPFLTKYSLDSVCETAFGICINAQDDPECKPLIAMNKLLNLVCERIFKLWLQPDWMYRLFPQYRSHVAYTKYLHDYVDCIISDKRKQLQSSEKIGSENSNCSLDGYKDKRFLDYLIEFSGAGDKVGYTDVELREETLTLTAAATDTSSVAMGYTLKLMAKYPEVQEKVYQELQEVFGNSDRPIQNEDLPKLKYLERVIRESIRLFTPVPFVIRKVEQEITLPSGRVLPAGCGVVVSLYGLNRDPKYWGPEAQHYNPDRFLPERLSPHHGASFIPFSTGPRGCPGYQYAFMSIKSALSSILRRYKVVGEKESGPIPYIRVKLDVMMKAVDEYEITLYKRE